MTINGHKVRVQLWDMGASTSGVGNGGAMAAPLFIRNAVGCIVVARNDKLESIKK